MLMILDGFGKAPDGPGNAISLAKTPHLDHLFATYPNTQLLCCGEAVGLPEGQMGNSEVGHLNIGAGRVIYQDLSLITHAIKDGSFFKNPELNKAMDHVLANDSCLHLLGLVSDGGVHSHIDHLFGLLDMAKQKGIRRVAVHAFLDGRDVPPQCAVTYLEQLDAFMKEIGLGTIATVAGRYYAMDRDKRWERVQKAYDAMTLANQLHADSAAEAVEESYERGDNDEFVLPTSIDPAVTVNDHDAMIMFNFRPDRAREITKAFCLTDEEIAAQNGSADDTKCIKYLKRAKGFLPLTYVCFKDYDETIGHKFVAFKKEEITNTFGEYLAANGLKQLRLAETEKYAHVTFFFNGGIEEPYKGEDRILVNSPAVATYDLQPEMSAPEVSEKLNAAIRGGEYDVIVINFANPDMVGHTGVLSAAISAVEYVDKCVGTAVEAVKEVGGVLFICADHGNCEQMVNKETGQPHTAHTTNPVPFILYNYDENYTLREGGRLCDIAPTLLEIMGMPQPKEMTGQSLLVRK
jgi:2,3-bisphosphoglycerate-independent phosphoglycerate mutase